MKMTTIEAAEFLGKKPITLQGWRGDGKGPPYYKVGRNVFYDKKDLIAYRDEINAGAVKIVPGQTEAK